MIDRDVVLLALAQFVEDALLLDADSVELRDGHVVEARWILPAALKPGHRDPRRALTEMTASQSEQLECEARRIAAEVMETVGRLGDQAEVWRCGGSPTRPGYEVFQLHDRERRAGSPAASGVAT